ncbi:hypothetical protein [Marinobacter sp. AC-23]|uniref:hypothetical protein n=1 Tax=Marinobacter sp. AC-23 TaxID=1879031 RepID=UPI000AA5AF48|nr:hypothetical protein [Marinobacter sp. AC-23]
MVQKTDKQVSSDPENQNKARALQDMLLDALHAMRSQEEVDELRKPAASEKAPEGIIDRLASLTGSAFRFGLAPQTHRCEWAGH